HGVVVEKLDPGGGALLDELELPALRDAELDLQLAFDPATGSLVRVDPLALDPLADLVEVVLELGLGRVERDRVALDAAPASLEPAATSATEHAGGRG